MVGQVLIAPDDVALAGATRSRDLEALGAGIEESVSCCMFGMCMVLEEEVVFVQTLVTMTEYQAEGG